MRRLRPLLPLLLVAGTAAAQTPPEAETGGFAAPRNAQSSDAAQATRAVDGDPAALAQALQEAIEARDQRIQALEAELVAARQALEALRGRGLNQALEDDQSEIALRACETRLRTAERAQASAERSAADAERDLRSAESRLRAAEAGERRAESDARSLRSRLRSCR